MKHALTLGRWTPVVWSLTLVGLATSPALADPPGKANRDERREERKEARDERREERKEARDERQEDRADAREDRKDDREERRADRDERREKAKAKLEEIQNDPDKRAKWERAKKEWADGREARRKKARAHIEEKWGGVLGFPAVQQELRRHAERVAKLERIRFLATELENEEALSRTDALLAKERARHEARMALLLENKGVEKGGAK